MNLAMIRTVVGVRMKKLALRAADGITGDVNQDN